MSDKLQEIVHQGNQAGLENQPKKHFKVTWNNNSLETQYQVILEPINMLP